MITLPTRQRSSLYLPHRNHHGFTLIELVILLAILSIVFHLAAPTFQNIGANSRMTAHINNMVTSFNYARSEAIKRNHNLVICPNDNGSCAREPHWHNGWLIFIDDNFNREIELGEEIIYVEAAKKNVEITSSRYRRRVVFRSTGYSYGSNASFIFCDQRGSSKARAIVLSNTGRARVADKKLNNKDWKCQG
ncbi:MAG: GspH/FimT family pseudopilin [Thiotrichaceae bacterium]|nr:GspH/FimT family pseudopilin [Thiotrichaceae bacterium]